MLSSGKQNDYQALIETIKNCVLQVNQYESEEFDKKIEYFYKKIKEVSATFSSSSQNTSLSAMDHTTSIATIQAHLLAVIIDIKQRQGVELDNLLHDKERAHNFNEFVNELDKKIEGITTLLGKLKTVRKLQHEKGLDDIPDVAKMNGHANNNQNTLKELNKIVESLRCPTFYSNTPKAVTYFANKKETCEFLLKKAYLLNECLVLTINTASQCAVRQAQIDSKNLEENNIASAEHTVNVLTQKVETLKSLARQLAETKGKQPAPGESPPRDRGGFFAPSPGASKSSSSSSSLSSSEESSLTAPKSASVVNAGAFSATHKEKISKEEKKQQKKAEKQAEKHSKIYF